MLEAFVIFIHHTTDYFRIIFYSCLYSNCLAIVKNITVCPLFSGQNDPYGWFLRPQSRNPVLYHPARGRSIGFNGEGKLHCSFPIHGRRQKRTPQVGVDLRNQEGLEGLRWVCTIVGGQNSVSFSCLLTCRQLFIIFFIADFCGKLSKSIIPTTLEVLPCLKPYLFIYLWNLFETVLQSLFETFTGQLNQ